VAEGEKESAILRAQARRESAILEAEAERQKRIIEAEGESQAIMMVQKAEADAIRLINEAAPSKEVLALRSFDAMTKVANGQATKIIIPSELQSLGGLVASIAEVARDK